jgi:hypothetical protein
MGQYWKHHVNYLDRSIRQKVCEQNRVMIIVQGFHINGNVN